jgi:hypothetical protein
MAHEEKFKHISHQLTEEIDKGHGRVEVRRHWRVENELYWVLDVCFREDHSCIRRENGAENMATARHITLNMLRQENSCKKGIKAKRFKAALDSDYAEKLFRVFFKRLCSYPVNLIYCLTCLYSLLR